MLVEHEALWRLGSFALVLLLMATAEALFPRRVRSQPRRGRWWANLSLVVIDTAVVRYGLPLLPVALAATAAAEGWGLLNRLQMGGWLALAAGVVWLDMLVYLQHVLFHKLPLFWRLHKIHHTDPDVDATTGVRFHPVEILVSMVIKLGGVAVLGVPVAAVILFEMVLNATSLFSHSNLRLPLRLDGLLRLLLVTPDMHRVHHSVIPRETDSNFGFNLSAWDRLFGTYRPQPAAGHDGMEIGLREYRLFERMTLGWLLSLPFVPERPNGGGGGAA
jgi:sterol desaturase/sphingolipid hydroxylase (fatty acid hydroxylase superfamily)